MKLKKLQQLQLLMEKAGKNLGTRQLAVKGLAEKRYRDSLKCGIVKALKRAFSPAAPASLAQMYYWPDTSSDNDTYQD